MHIIHDSSPVPLGSEGYIGCLGDCSQGRTACERECAEMRSELSSAWANSDHAQLEQTHREVEPWAWLAAGMVLAAVAAGSLIAWGLK